MRLVNTTTCLPYQFDGTSFTPPYATLSHCCGADEVLLDDLGGSEGAAKKLGFAKVLGACFVARHLGMQWLRIDTECIDRSSPVEIAKAANSTFQWYRNCEVCIVHLSDLQYQRDEVGGIEDQLRRCRWMQRSWTLQELMAPHIVQFYDTKWTLIGTNWSLLATLSTITRIDTPVLNDAECLSNFSVTRKMSWAASRSASQVEDVAYSLLRIFGDKMHIIYGEDRRAFVRLQKEILKDMDDDLSLLAWKSSDQQLYRGILAAGFGHIATRGTALLTSLPEGSAKEIRVKHDVSLRISELIAEHMARARAQQKQWSLEEPGILSKHEPLGTSDRVTNINSPVSYPSPLATSPALNKAMNEGAIKTVGTEAAFFAVSSQDINSNQFRNSPTSTDNSSHAENPPSSQLRDELSRWLARGAPEFSCNSSEHMEELQSSIFQSSALGSDKRAEEDLIEEDDDMYLFTDSPPDHLVLEMNHPFALVKDEILKFTLQTLSCLVTEDQPYLGNHIRQELPPPRCNRLRLGPDEDIELGQCTNLLGEQNIRTRCHRITNSPAFACPYYARNPQAYQNCLRYADLRNIKDVKKHLWIAHRLPPFCPICRETFESAMVCNRHVTERSCTLQTFPDIEGITQVQMQQLARRSSPALSEKMKWLAIWKIIFPTEVRPARAVLLGDIEIVVCVLRNFWAERGQYIITAFMEMKGLREYDQVQDEERGLAALYAVVLEQLIEQTIARFWEAEIGPTRQANGGVEGVSAILRDLCRSVQHEQLYTQPDRCRNCVRLKDIKDELKCPMSHCTREPNLRNYASND
ncbi:hypothetical protein QQS21_003772 [Conoideocrella luteorostrata]|uniref:Heterokaryon incompatibility domain-containing protein n=1 Tax=Conoideocrella luteorostrata TaxID=1105319 RepID=A0AAJ0CVN6_9HYPO|nr:hypothetical protein QQS21_003772 [Conoideocrella luteorostrata]